MAGNGRLIIRFRVDPNGVIPAFSEKFATTLLKVANQVATFHACNITVS